MSRTGLLGLLMLTGMVCASGCLGVSQNPSYFPYWLPTGDVVPMHAKPIGPAYFSNFDPHAVDLTRGNSDKADDVMLRPGQSWCVVSSADEGDTHVQVVVPGIFNWDKRMKTAVVRWVDAAWEFPPRGLAKPGAEHELITKITRVSDRQPLTKYRVRYKIIDGPPAILLPSRTQEEVAISDLNGLAKVRIALAGPGAGVTRVSVEIIRPPDPTTPSGAGVSIITGETAVEWQGRVIELGPPVTLPEPKLGPPEFRPDMPLGPPRPLGAPVPR